MRQRSTKAMELLSNSFFILYTSPFLFFRRVDPLSYRSLIHTASFSYILHSYFVTRVKIDEKMRERTSRKRLFNEKKFHDQFVAHYIPTHVSFLFSPSISRSLVSYTLIPLYFLHVPITCSLFHPDVLLSRKISIRSRAILTSHYFLATSINLNHI